MKILNSKTWLLILVMSFAAVLRLYGYYSWSLTNDELSALLGYSYGSLYNNVFVYVQNDFHPAGTQIIIWFWCKIFGTSVAALRLPFVIMGILSVYMTYLTSRKWFNYYAAVLISATLAVSQFAILYSQLARPYSTGLFFVLLTVYGWNGFVFLQKNQKPKFLSLIFFVLGMILSMYNHYFSFLMVAIIGLSGLFLVSKLNRKMYLFCGATAVILFLPHLKITIQQFSAGGLGWLAPPDSSYFQMYTKYMFNNSKWYLLFILLFALIAAIKLPYKMPENKMKWVALIWFLIPLLTAYFYSIYVSPVLQHSILIFSYPFFLFFLFSITPINQKSVFVLVPAILVAGSIQLFAINKFNGSNEFARFKEIAEHINSADRKYGASNITRAINITDSSYIGYYLSKLGNKSKFEFYHNAGRAELTEVINVVRKSNTPYFMYSWTNSDCPPEINQIIQDKYPYLIEKVQYFNSEYYLYSRNSLDSIRQIKVVDKVFCQNYEVEQKHFTNPIIFSKDSSGVVNTFETMNEKIEYSSTFSLPLNEITNNTSNIIHARVSLKTQSNDADAALVFSINHGAENYFWTSLNLKSFITKLDDWNCCYYAVRLPILKSPDDKITVYVLNLYKKNIQIDNFEVKVEQGNPILYGPREDRYIFNKTSNEPSN